MTMDHLPNEPDNEPDTTISQGVPGAFEGHGRTESPVPDDKTDADSDEQSWPQSGFGSFP